MPKMLVTIEIDYSNIKCYFEHLFIKSTKKNHWEKVIQVHVLFLITQHAPTREYLNRMPNSDGFGLSCVCNFHAILQQSPISPPGEITANQQDNSKHLDHRCLARERIQNSHKMSMTERNQH